MAIMAYYLKLHAPGAKTFLQIIRVLLFIYVIIIIIMFTAIAVQTAGPNWLKFLKAKKLIFQKILNFFFFIFNNSITRLGLVEEPI